MVGRVPLLDSEFSSFVLFTGCCHKNCAGRLLGGSLVSTRPCRLKKRGPAVGGVEGSVLDTAEVRVILVSVFVSSNQALFDQLEIFCSTSWQ